MAHVISFNIVQLILIIHIFVLKNKRIKMCFALPQKAPEKCAWGVLN